MVYLFYIIYVSTGLILLLFCVWPEFFFIVYAGAVPITGKTTGDGSEDAVLVVDDDGGSGSIYNKYGPNQYAERDIIVPSRPPTACSESRRLTPAE